MRRPPAMVEGMVYDRGWCMEAAGVGERKGDGELGFRFRVSISIRMFI